MALTTSQLQLLLAATEPAPRDLQTLIIGNQAVSANDPYNFLFAK